MAGGGAVGGGDAGWHPAPRGPVPLGTSLSDAGASAAGWRGSSSGFGRVAVPLASTAAGGSAGSGGVPGGAARPQPLRTSSVAPTPPRVRHVVFEYIGSGALSVTSSITGRHYRFDAPGARVDVDPRDWSQLSRVSLIRQVPAAA